MFQPIIKMVRLISSEDIPIGIMAGKLCQKMISYDAQEKKICIFDPMKQRGYKVFKIKG
jgi:hypothetical protein